jgi:hypothetical protein
MQRANSIRMRRLDFLLLRNSAAIIFQVIPSLSIPLSISAFQVSPFSFSSFLCLPIRAIRTCALSQCLSAREKNRIAFTLEAPIFDLSARRDTDQRPTTCTMSWMAGVEGKSSSCWLEALKVASRRPREQIRAPGNATLRGSRQLSDFALLFLEVERGFCFQI